MIICPECGNVIGWNSYFSCYYCYNCGSHIERETRCNKCVNEIVCRANGTIWQVGKCSEYHRDAPDGGYYG